MDICQKTFVTELQVFEALDNPIPSHTNASIVAQKEVCAIFIKHFLTEVEI